MSSVAAEEETSSDSNLLNLFPFSVPTPGFRQSLCSNQGLWQFLVLSPNPTPSAYRLIFSAKINPLYFPLLFLSVAQPTDQGKKSVVLVVVVVCVSVGSGV